MKINSLYIILLLFMLNSLLLSQTIIINKTNPVENLSKAELYNIYLGNTSTWENSKQITIVDYVADNQLRINFSDTFLNLSPKRVSMIWIKVSLSGKTVPPKVFHTEDEIIRFVSENEGAIGYISKAKELPENIKIIRIQ